MALRIAAVAACAPVLHSALRLEPRAAAVSVEAPPGPYVPGLDLAGFAPGSGRAGTLTPSTRLRPVYAPRGQKYITVTSNQVGKIFWTQVRIPAGSRVCFDNCWFAGQDPATITTLTGCIRNFMPATGLPGRLQFRDCTISSKPWISNHVGRPLPAGTVRKMSGYSAGIHGGHFYMARTEIKDVQDGVNYVTRTGTSCLITHSRIHSMYYENGITYGSGGQAHSDCFQFNTGKDVEIRYSVIGGARNQAGYDRWPGGANTGADAYNSGFQIKQEVNATLDNKIERFNIHHNWIWGGVTGLALNYVASRRNTFADCKITDNWFLVRPAAWGVSTGETGYSRRNGAYFRKSPSARPTMRNNRLMDPTSGADRGPVPMTNAGDA